jgi:hypothetical protein
MGSHYSGKLVGSVVCQPAQSPSFPHLPSARRAAGMQGNRIPSSPRCQNDLHHRRVNYHPPPSHPPLNSYAGIVRKLACAMSV